MHLAHFSGQPFGFEHLDAVSFLEQFSYEVQGRAEVVCKVGVVFCLGYEGLAVVQGQIFQVVAFCAEGAEHDSFDGGAVLIDNAEAFGEELFCPEVFVHFEFDVCLFQLFYAVEGENSVVSVVLQLPQHVPSALEEFDAVWCDDSFAGYVRSVFLVLDLNVSVSFHGFDDEGQDFVAGGDGFEGYPVVDGLAFADQVVYGQGGNHPVLYAVFLQCVGVFDIVLVSVFGVAQDVDAEYFFNGCSVPVEGCACHFFAFAHVCFHPFAVDFLQCNAFCTGYGVDKPDVFFEDGLRSHGFSWYLNGCFSLWANL